MSESMGLYRNLGGWGSGESNGILWFTCLLFIGNKIVEQKMGTLILL